MEMIALYDAKNRLSEICKQVTESGQPCVISRRGQPAVKIVPFGEASATDASGAPASVWDTVEESQARYGTLTDEFEFPDRSKHANPSPLDWET
ncbi:MAG: type II toxin-antitoxin system prevent-host-death family antitoxin [Verrucomicrobia bacterium]|jgi:prevent-host-death family protein|nr:type II toxin-antitoxin system prevent-host-death family antitoxin [Verrucomicrobiota bacterium]